MFSPDPEFFPGLCRICFDHTGDRYFWHEDCIIIDELLTPVRMSRCNGGHLLKKKGGLFGLFFFALTEEMLPSGAMNAGCSEWNFRYGLFVCSGPALGLFAGLRCICCDYYKAWCFRHEDCMIIDELLTPVRVSRCNGGHLLEKKEAFTASFFLP